MLPAHDVLARVGEEFHGLGGVCHVGADSVPAVARAVGGVFRVAFLPRRPALADSAERSFKWLHTILVNKYGFDWFNENVIVAFARMLGGGLWRCGDQMLIDDGLVNGSARTGRLVRLGDALRAVGIPVSLRVRNDSRLGLSAAVADMADLIWAVICCPC